MDGEWYVYLGVAVAILAFLIGGARQAVMLWHLLRGDAEPRHNPPLHQTYASRTALNEIKERVDGLAQANSVSRGKIYDLIRALEKGQSALVRDSENQTQWLARLEGKIDAAIRDKGRGGNG